MLSPGSPPRVHRLLLVEVADPPVRRTGTSKTGVAFDFAQQSLFFRRATNFHAEVEWRLPTPDHPGLSPGAYLLGAGALEVTYDGKILVSQAAAFIPLSEARAALDAELK